jgi:hypothetical protein
MRSRTSGSMSGERKRGVAAWPKQPRLSSTLPHEALIDEWPILIDWLDSNRAQLQRLQRLLLGLVSVSTIFDGLVLKIIDG